MCGSDYWSFYLFDNLSNIVKKFFLFFGDSPCFGITYGVRIEVALASLLVGFYAFSKTNKILRSFLAAFISYFVLFVLGAFPSFLTFVIMFWQKHIFSIESYDVAGIFLSTSGFLSIKDVSVLNALNVKMNLFYAFFSAIGAIFYFWLFYKNKFWKVVKNIRWIQVLVHVGLVIFGFSLAIFYFPQNITINIFSFLALANIFLGSIFAWVASVFINDIEDRKIDEISNFKRPLVEGYLTADNYRDLFWLFFIMSLVLSLSVGIKFFLIALIYQIIAWMYSAYPFRLKRFPFIATFTSSLAITLWFLAGFILLSDKQQISEIPPKIIFLLLIAFTFSLPIKDLKDIEGDRKNKIWTIPVILGEKWARFFIGFFIFISYALSVIWLNVKILFIPAMLCGAISFALLNKASLSSRRVHVLVFWIIFIYAVCVITFFVGPVIFLKLKLSN